MAAAEEALATFHGDGGLPDRLGGGRARAPLDLRRPPLPQPGLAALLRHRRLVADLRPHVPPLRDAVRRGLGREEVNGYVYMAAIPADPDVRAEATEYQARYVAARAARPELRRADRRLPRLRAAALRARTSSTGGATACGPRSSGTSPISTATTRDAASLVELAVLLEDAIDVHDRHWKIHWMLNFAQFSATMALNATIAGGQGRGRPGARRAAAELGRRPQLGLDRGALADEGGGQGRPRAAPPPSRGDTAADVVARARRRRSAAAASSRSGSARTGRSSATRRSGRTSSSTRPGARTRRRSSRRFAATSRPTTTSRRRSQRRASDDLERRDATSCMDGVPDGRGARPACRRRSTSRCG